MNYLYKLLHKFALTRTSNNNNDLDENTALQTDIPEFAVTNAPKYKIEPLSQAQSQELPELPDIIWESKLASGNFGTVYKACDNQKFDYAIKKVKKERIVQYGNLDRFIAESKNWIDLDLNLNIVNCYFVEEFDGVPYIFMEYIPYKSLQSWIEKSIINNLPMIIRFAYQIAAGLKYMHNKRLIHQDIKPDNILIDIIEEQVVAKISDFTLVAKTDENGYATCFGGTKVFSSPEQEIKGERINNKTDIWSWASTVLQMFTKDVLWASGKSAPQILKQYYQNFTNKHGYITLPKSLYDLLKQCFSEKPDERPDAITICSYLKKIYEQETGKLFNDIEIDSTLLNSINYNNKGVSYWNIGDKNNSLLAFHQAVNYNPDNLTAIFNLSIIRWSIGIIPHDSEILKILDDSYGNQEMDWYVDYLKGRTYFYSRQSEKAKEAFLKSKKSNPDYLPTDTFLRKIEENKKQFHYKITKVEGHSDTVLCIDASDELIVSGSWDKTVRVFDINKYDCISVLEGHEDHISSISLSRCGRFAVSGDMGGTIRYWDLQHEKCIKSLRLPKYGEYNFNISVSCIAFLKDNNFIISADGNGNQDSYLRIWNLKTGDCVKVIEGHLGRINSLVIAHDYNFFVTSSQDNTVKIWDLNSYNCVAHIVGNTKYANIVEERFRYDKQYISFADINTENNQLLIANSDSSINLYDISSSEKTITLYGHSEWVKCVRWIPESNFAISTSSDEIKIWDIGQKTCMSTIKTDTCNHRFNFLYSNNKLYLSSDNSIQVWHIGNILPIKPALILEKVSSAFEQIHISKEIKEEIEKIKNLINQEDKEKAYLILREIKRKYINLKNHSYLKKLENRITENATIIGIEEIWSDGTISWTDKAQGSNISSLDISKDNTTIIASSHDGIIFISDIITKRIFSILHSNDDTNCIKFIENNHALSAGKDVIKLWNLDNLELINYHSFDLTFGGINSIDYFQSSDLVLIGLGELGHKSLILYNLLTQELLYEFKDEADLFPLGGGLSSVQFSSNGKYALSGDNKGNIKLWDLEKKILTLNFIGHSDSILFVCFYKSDTSIVSVSSDNTIRIWDVILGKCSQIIECSQKSITSIAITKDEKYLVLLEEENSLGLIEKDNSIQFWNLNTFKCDFTYCNINQNLSEIAITNNSKYIVTGGGDRTIRIFGIDWKYDFKKEKSEILKEENREQLKVLKTAGQAEIHPFISIGHSSDISTLIVVGFSYLISGSHDNTIKIWDLNKNGICINTLEGHTAAINAIISTSNNKYLISGSNDCNTIVWNFNSGKIEHIFSEHKSPVNTIAIDSNNKQIVSGSSDGQIIIWDFETKKRIQTIGMEKSVKSLIISSDDKYIVAGSEDGITSIWDFKTFKYVKSIENPSSIVKICQSSNSQYLYIGYSNGEILIVEFPSFNYISKITTDNNLSDFCISYNKYLITCQFQFNNSSVSIRSLENNDVLKEIRNIGRSKHLALYPFGYFFIGLAKGHILFVETSTGEFKALLSGQDDDVWCVKISQNKSYIITGYYNCFIIYNIHTGKQNIFKDDHNIIDVDFSADNKYAYAINYYSKVYQVELESLQVIKEYESSTLGNLNSMTFRASYEDDHFEYNIVYTVLRDVKGISVFNKSKKDDLSDIASKEFEEYFKTSKIRYALNGSLSSNYHSSLNEVLLLDMYDKGKEINFKFEMENNKNIESVLIAYDNKHLISKNDDGTVRIWDIKTQKQTRTIIDYEKENNINKITCFNENIILVGCNNGKIKLWNINTGEQIITFQAHQGSVSCLNMSADRNFIISGGKGDGVKIWSTESFKLVVSLIMFGKTDYALFTPYDEFFLSNPEYLQFFEQKNDESRSIITNEEEGKVFLKHFVDIKQIEKRLLGMQFT